MNIYAETCRYRHMTPDYKCKSQWMLSVAVVWCWIFFLQVVIWSLQCLRNFYEFLNGMSRILSLYIRWCSACLLIQYDTAMLWLCRVLVEPKPLTAVRPRPASSAALSTMNNKHNASSSPPSSHHLSVLTKVLRMFRSHSDPSVPRPPSPPRRRAAPAGGPPRSSSASPCTAAAQQQQVSRFTAANTYGPLQWLKCNGTQGNAVPLPPIYGSKRSPTSGCYNAREKHTTTNRGPRHKCTVSPPLRLHFNHWSSEVSWYDFGVSDSYVMRQWRCVSEWVIS